jgi:hypothetical protein
MCLTWVRRLTFISINAMYLSFQTTSRLHFLYGNGGQCALNIPWLKTTVPFIFTLKKVIYYQPGGRHERTLVLPDGETELHDDPSALRRSVVKNDIFPHYLHGIERTGTRGAAHRPGAYLRI